MYDFYSYFYFPAIPDRFSYQELLNEINRRIYAQKFVGEPTEHDPAEIEYYTHATKQDLIFLIEELNFLLYQQGLNAP